MAIVNRFSFPHAISAGTDLFVAGVGYFRKGIFDVLSSDTSTLATVRGLVTPYGAVEQTNVDTSVAPAPAQPGDPYPQYLRAEDFINSVQGGTDGVSLSLKAASVAAVQAAIGSGDLAVGPSIVTDPVTGRRALLVG